LWEQWVVVLLRGGDVRRETGLDCSLILGLMPVWALAMARTMIR
jgi:hypothetical protein